MTGLSVRGLCKRFAAHDGKSPQVSALDGLELEVEEGELLVLVGPSGCGKSTALRLIAGLDEPTGGSIALDGRDLINVPPQDRDVAMVFQGYALYPHLTAQQNMGFPLKMRGIKPAPRAKKVAEIAELVGLSDKLDRLPSELSGGERQRVAMGRAIVRSPKVFLFDEPLSNLDAKLRGELRVELVRLLRELEVTAIYVTHDQAEAMTMADRVAVLRDGKLQQLAPPRELYERPANTFVAGFIGTPMMNLIETEVKDGRAETEAISLPVPPQLHDRQQLTAGIRPEHLRLTEPQTAAQSASDEQGRIEATVHNLEPLGAETFVYLDAAGRRLRARLEGFGGPEVGAALVASVASGDILWFDADSGDLLDPEDDGQ